MYIYKYIYMNININIYIYKHKYIYIYEIFFAVLVSSYIRNAQTCLLKNRTSVITQILREVCCETCEYTYVLDSISFMCDKCSVNKCF